MLPVPDYVYTMLAPDRIKTMTFTVTPVFFNVGLNEKATLAHKLGQNGPQEKNNLDNFKILYEYFRRYKKSKLPTATNLYQANYKRELICGARRLIRRNFL